MARSTAPEQRLIEQLVALLGGTVRHGETLSGELSAGMDGDVPLLAQITIKVERRVYVVEREAWLVEALAELRQKPYLVLRCSCHNRKNTRRKSAYLQGPRCSARVTHAVRYTSRVDGKSCFVFVCGTHAKHPDLHPDCVDGAIALNARVLGEIHALQQAESAQRHREADTS